MQNLERIPGRRKLSIDSSSAIQPCIIDFRSFDAYFLGLENGASHVGQEYLALPQDVRQAVREDVRKEVGDTGGPIRIDIDITFAGGQK